jgi:HEAT repeat protein
MSGDGTFRATDKQPARRLGGVTGHGFMPGRSGNPAGRAKGIEALAREHTPAAIAALVKALENPRERVPAAVALLNRGWGLPRQAIETDPATSAIGMHLLAAGLVSAEIIQRQSELQPQTIQQEQQLQRLIDAPLPLE